MANRLSKITTRTGDAGETGLGDGSRVGKDALRIQALGDIDECNSAIGLMLTEDLPGEIRAALNDVQHDMFDFGGEICIPGHTAMQADHVARLDALLARFNRDLPPLKEFILPGGSRAGALCHVARSVCRRAERRVIALASKERLSPYCIQYLNRLSDLLFVLSRTLNRRQGHGDVLWQKGRTLDPDQ